MKLSRRIASFLGATALAGTMLFATASPVHGSVFVQVGVAPPEIPVYAQPPIPGEGYIWTPGYWAWTDDGYVWVDGAWVLPPYVGALWTPGYWGYGGGGYFWNAGYWGPYVGYYGGLNYGFGYFGTGFYGGYWHGGHFWYNGCYNHFGPGFHSGHFYNTPIHGWDGRPGGASWARGGHEGFNGNRGSYVNGHNFASGNGYRPASTSHFGGFGNGSRPAYNGYNGGNYNAGRSFASSPSRSFAMPSQGRSMGNFASAQPRGNFGGGNFGGGSSFHGNAGGYGGGGYGGGGFHGGGFHGGGGYGGGGGFHGGGGGGGFHGGGGGHR